MKMNIKEKIKDYIRVLKMNKTPTREKFLETLRICVVGVVILGIIGFIFYLFFTILGL